MNTIVSMMAALTWTSVNPSAPPKCPNANPTTNMNTIVSIMAALMWNYVASDRSVSSSYSIGIIILFC